MGNHTDHELDESQTEQNIRINFSIKDARERVDSVQVLLLNERMKTDEVDLAWTKTKVFLGKYSTVEPRDLAIRLADGKVRWLMKKE